MTTRISMKLNYKRTILVGFAFFIICMFWQAYDTTIPLILTNKFGMSQAWSGAIMALDNVLALFLLPFFGALSDKCTAKRGKRTPFILVGTLLAVVFFVGLSLFDARQLTMLDDVTPDKYQESLSTIYDANPSIPVPEAEDNDGMSLTEALAHLVAPERKQALQDVFPEKQQFLQITMYATDSDGTPTSVVNQAYTDYVIPARNAYAWQKTVESPLTLVFFILLLLAVLVSMGIFRSPAVALMPDVTPKPMRSKANAIINLMGSFGGITVLVLGMIFKTGDARNALMSYLPFFVTVAALMLVGLVVFLLTVREKAWAAEAEAVDGDRDGEGKQEAGKSVHPNGETAVQGGEGHLSPAERRSLIFILLSVALWYMGYNAVTSKYSVYAGQVLNMDYNLTLIIAQAAAILSYIPIGVISSRVGRKKAILAGVIILSVSFGTASFMRADSPILLMNILFALAGIGWATINVNSYPMVVEMAHGGRIGKYTGYYYTASMAAQVLTPILSGILLDIRFTSLFPYATVFVVLAFVTMLFVRHGDSKPPVHDSLIEHIGTED